MGGEEETRDTAQPRLEVTPIRCEKGWIRVTGQSKSPNSLAGWWELGVDRLRTLAPVHPKPRPTAFESFPKEIRWLVIGSGEALLRFSSASPPSPSGKGGWDVLSAAGSCRGDGDGLGQGQGQLPNRIPAPPAPKQGAGLVLVSFGMGEQRPSKHLLP